MLENNTPGSLCLKSIHGGVYKFIEFVFKLCLVVEFRIIDSFLIKPNAYEYFVLKKIFNLFRLYIKVKEFS